MYQTITAVTNPYDAIKVLQRTPLWNYVWLLLVFFLTSTFCCVSIVYLCLCYECCEREPSEPLELEQIPDSNADPW